jgi:hypothetical protein
MSLQLAAQHLSSQGRGNDSMLVHMSPREVKGLNDLAMAHGGQLSINPQTGLPEAGFLSSILPMIAGAALTASGVGPGMAALMVGGGMTVMTGSLEKGLMAGLGAYGGANLGSGLLASGTDAAVASAPEVAAAQQNAATQMQNFYDPAAQAFKPGGLEAVQKASMDASTAQAAARNLAAPDFMGKLQAMGKGIGSLGQEGGFSNLYQNLGGSPMSLLQSVGSAAAPAIGGMMTPKKIEEEKADSDLGQRYGFSMNPTGGQTQVQPGQDPLANTSSPTTTPFPDINSRERRYFNPQYTKITSEEAKKLYGFADGGVAQIDEGSYVDPHERGVFYDDTKDDYSGQQPMPPAAAQTPPERYGFTPEYVDPHERGVFYDDTKDDYADPRKRGVYSGQQPMPPAAETLPPGSIERPIGIFPEPNYGNPPAETLPPAAVNPPTETPALQSLKQMQAKRAARPPISQIDTKSEFEKYLQKTIGASVPQTPFATVTPPPAAVNSTSELIYDPIKKTYTQNPNLVNAKSTDNPLSPENLANNFAANNPGVPHSRIDPKTGEMVEYDRYGRKMVEYDRYGNVYRGYSQPVYRGKGTYASGGVSHLGDYSDGGRLLRGPGDGVSDSIPAMIGKRQPARLADGEFVVPARIVSELGNGSTEAGARKLYAMMDRIQKARGKTVGKNKVAKNSRSEKYLPA